MNKLEFKSLIDGMDDEFLIGTLFHSMCTLHNKAQRTFFLVWSVMELLGSDGFEMLLEQEIPLDEYSAAFDEIGMPGIRPIFDRVLALFPKEILSKPDNNWSEVLDGSFDKLKSLLYEYYDASENVVTSISAYIREHHEDFVEFIDTESE